MASIQHILPGGFDVGAVAPQENRSYAPMPSGAYDVEITGSDVKETSTKKGTALKLEFTVISPAAFAKRKVFHNINIKHESSEAERIGQSQLSALCRAAGIARLNDSDELFQKIIRVYVKIKAASNGYEASNDVTGYEASGTPLPVVSQGAQRAVNAAATPAPWLRKG